MIRALRGLRPRRLRRAPRANAVCECLVGPLRRELLGHLLILGEAHLRAVIAEHAARYDSAILCW